MQLDKSHRAVENRRQLLKDAKKKLSDTQRIVHKSKPVPDPRYIASLEREIKELEDVIDKDTEEL